MSQCTVPELAAVGRDTRAEPEHRHLSTVADGPCLFPLAGRSSSVAPRVRTVRHHL